MRSRRSILVAVATLVAVAAVAVGATDGHRSTDDAVRLTVERPGGSSPPPTERTGGTAPPPTDLLGIDADASSTPTDPPATTPTIVATWPLEPGGTATTVPGSSSTGGSSTGSSSTGSGTTDPVGADDPGPVDVADDANAPEPDDVGPDGPDPEQPEPADPDPEQPPPDVGPFLMPRIPAPDQVECPQLASVAIGSSDPGSPDADLLRAAGLRFRTQVGVVQDAADRDRGGALVCATDLVQTWRNDLVVQGLRAGPAPFGVLVTGRDPEDPVLWLSETEWMSWDWHPAGSDGQTDFNGVPQRRTTVDGVDVILTDLGGVILARDDSPGVALVGGAWTRWLASGGPSGPMGLPATFPTGQGVGAEQGFTLGVLRLPGVTNPFDAITRLASEYRWTPFSEEPPTMDVPPNSIVKFGTPSYYVDHEGVRHWLETQADWSCARYDLGATVIGSVDAGTLGALPLGERFVCPGRTTP